MPSMDEEVPGAQQTMLITTGFFNINLLAGSLAVLSIPNQFVSKCAWWLIREYGRPRPKQPSFSSLVMDDDGLSLVCDPQALSLLKFLIKPEEFTLSDKLWRAFVIETTGSADEVPGAVYCLAQALSSQGLSILHISTFEAEVFLIQEQDLEQTCRILRGFEDPATATALLGEACKVSNQRPRLGSASNPTGDISQVSLEDADQDEDTPVRLDMSWITPSASDPAPAPLPPPMVKHMDGFKLCTLPQPVILARLQNTESDWEECTKVLTKMLLYDERFNPLEKLVQEGGDSSASISFAPRAAPALVHKASFMWGIWQQQGEITVLMEEDDIYSFPNHVLTRSPQRWKVIKLCGRPIAFNETGVVSAMSRVETSIPSLNISTTTTNCTLVPEELLEGTMARLSEVLNCPVHAV